jgi:hypothetical protein
MPTFAPCAIVALLAFTVIRIKRAEKIGDEFSDADIRTASLAEMLGTLRPVRNSEGGCPSMADGPVNVRIAPMTAAVSKWQPLRLIRETSRSFPALMQ